MSPATRLWATGPPRLGAVPASTNASALPSATIMVTLAAASTVTSVAALIVVILAA